MVWVPSLEPVWLKEKEDSVKLSSDLHKYAFGVCVGGIHRYTHIRRLPQKGGGFPSSCLPLEPTLKAQDPKEMDVQGWVGSVTLPPSLIFWNRVWQCYPGWPWIYNSPVSAWVLWLCATMWNSDSLSLETSRSYKYFSLSPPTRLIRENCKAKWGFHFLFHNLETLQSKIIQSLDTILFILASSILLAV
jgi:hypothetical protein